MQRTDIDNQSLLSFIILNRKFWGMSGFALGMLQTYKLTDWIVDQGTFGDKVGEISHSLSQEHTGIALAAALAMSLAWGKAGQYIMHRLHDSFIGNEPIPDIALSAGLVKKALQSIKRRVLDMKFEIVGLEVRSTSASLDHLISIVDRLPNNQMIVKLLRSEVALSLSPWEFRSILRNTQSILCGHIRPSSEQAQFDIVFSEIKLGRVRQMIESSDNADKTTETDHTIEDISSCTGFSRH